MHTACTYAKFSVKNVKCVGGVHAQKSFTEQVHAQHLESGKYQYAEACNRARKMANWLLSQADFVSRVWSVSLASASLISVVRTSQVTILYSVNI